MMFIRSFLVATLLVVSVLSQDARYYWSADNTFEESNSKKEYTQPIFSGYPQYLTDGVCKQAFHFTEGRWNITYDPVYGSFNSVPFTISFWVQFGSDLDNTTGTQWAVISKRTGCDYAGNWWDIRLAYLEDSWRVVFHQYSDGVTYPIRVVTSSPLNPNEFYHIAIVRETSAVSSNTTIWVNGEAGQYSTADSVQLGPYDTTPLHFGYSDCENDVNGSDRIAAPQQDVYLDEVKIFYSAQDPLSIYQTRCGVPPDVSNLQPGDIAKKTGRDTDQYIIAGIFLSIGILIVVVIVLLLTRSKKNPRAQQPHEDGTTLKVKVSKEHESELVSPAKKQILEEDDGEIQTPKKRSSLTIGAGEDGLITRSTDKLV